MDVDQLFMHKALRQAQAAMRRGEVPVGAVVVKEGQVIARAHNLRESGHDPSAHAELLAIRRAAKKLGRWRLSGCTLYVTLEPCAMCAGAIINARVDRVVYGAADPKAGCCESLYALLADNRFNHRPRVTAGVMAQACGALLTEFFRDKRRPKRTEE